MKKIFLFFVGYVFGMLIGCTTTQSQYCINVEEDMECPVLDEVNDTTFPVEDCGGTHTKATEFSTRNESVSIWEEDTTMDAQFDGCCYTTSYVAPVDADCFE